MKKLFVLCSIFAFACGSVYAEEKTETQAQSWYLDLGLGNTSFARVLSENIEGEIGAYIPVFDQSHLIGLYFNQLSAMDNSSHYSQQSGGIAFYHFGGPSAGEGFLLHAAVGYGSLPSRSVLIRARSAAYSCLNASASAMFPSLSKKSRRVLRASWLC